MTHFRDPISLFVKEDYPLFNRLYLNESLC